MKKLTAIIFIIGLMACGGGINEEATTDKIVDSVMIEATDSTVVEAPVLTTDSTVVDTL